MAAVPTTPQAAAGGDDQIAPPAGNRKPKNRLSESEVRWILSRERQEFAPNMSDCPAESVEILTRATEAFNVLRDNFAEFQEEVRAEYEAKGYIEVDDDFFERREEHRQSMREELVDLFDGIDLSGITFSDRYYNFDDDGEGEEDIYNFDEEDESEGEEGDGEEDKDEQEGAEDEEEDVDDEQEGTNGAPCRRGRGSSGVQIHLSCRFSLRAVMYLCQMPDSVVDETASLIRATISFC